jgi:hypothetical protein
MLWRFFLLEKDQILRDRRHQLEKHHRNIGLSRALQEWLQHHRPLWIAGLKT